MKTVCRFIAISLFFAVIAAAPNAMATNYTWCGAGGDNQWTNSANWLLNGTTVVTAGYPGVSAAGTPSTADSAFFSAGTSAEIALSSALTISTLNLSAANLDVTFVGGPSGTNAPLTVSSTLNLSGANGTLSFYNFGLLTPAATTLGASRTLDLLNASFLKSGTFNMGSGASVSIEDGSGMHVQGGIAPPSSGGCAFSLFNGSRLRVTGNTTWTQDSELSLSGASSMIFDANITAYRASSIYLAGESSLVANQIYFGYPGQSITIDNSRIESRTNCYLGDAAPGGGTFTFSGAHPLLIVRNGVFRYARNNADMTQPVVFDFIVPEGGFPEAPIQHLLDSGTQSFRGADNPKAVAKFTVNASSPALSAGTKTETPLFLSQPGIAHISKPYSDTSDPNAAFSFVTVAGGAPAANDADSKILMASIGSGTVATPAAVGTSGISPVLPVAIAHKTITASVAVAALSTTADSTVVRLYAGLSANGSDAEVVAETPVSAVGVYAVSWTAPEGAFERTYYLQAEIADLDANGQDIFAMRGDIKTAKTVDSATYTWIGGASGNWGDAANWSDNKGGNCIGIPNSTDATADFPVLTRATIIIDGIYTVKNLYLNKQDYDLTFASGGASTNESRLTAATFNPNAFGGKITFDGVAIVGGGFTVGPGRTMTLRNGANFHCTGDAYLRENCRCVISDGSWLSVVNLEVQDSNDADGLYIIDDATVAVRSNCFAPYNNKGGGIRFQGTRPLLRFMQNSNHFRSNNANGGAFVEFLVPAGGYEACPIQGTGAMSVKLGNNGNNAGTTTIAFRVLPDSPAFFADATFTQPLVSWETAGINKSMLTLECENTDGAFVWGEGTYPTTLSVTIAGSSHGDRLVVTGAPSEIPANGIVYGVVDGLSANDTRTFTAPSGTISISASHRATCVGWRLYAVDPATGARTLERASSSLSCDYVHDGSLHELEWRWSEEFLVAPSAGTGGAVSAPVWVENGSSATITATPDAGYVFRDWTGVSADGLEFAASRPFTATNAATPAARFDVAIYASPEGSASPDGSRANPYTLSAAIAACSARSDAAVVLLSGDYRLSASLTISSAVRITSESGDPADVAFLPTLDNKGNPTAVATLVKLTSSGARLSNVTVSGGTPSGANPGDIRVENATLYNCVITGIKSGTSSAGGAAYLKNGRITRSLVGVNTFNGACVGGGVFMEGDNSLLEYSCITNNRANGYGDGGGGVHAKAGTISHCVIVDNRTRSPLGHGSGGGGIRVNGKARVEWCLIAGNYCGGSGGGGIMLSSTAGTVVDHCTIADNNSSEYYLGGVNMGAAAVIRNSIVWGNTVSIPTDRAAGELNSTSDGFANSYDNCLPRDFGRNALVANPLFADSVSGDYRLLPGSPCAELGYGCIPYDFETLQVGFPAFADETFPSGEALSFEAAASGGAGGYAFRWRVDDLLAGTDGAWSAQSAESLFEPTLSPGHYRLTVEVADSQGATATFSRELYAGVAHTVYVVPAGTAGNDPQPPYDTQATAANDPCDAIPYCAAGATLLVAGGDYGLLRELYVPRAVQVVAAEGPDATSLYRKGPSGSGESRRVVHLHAPGASLAGFTVTNGYYADVEIRLGSGVFNEGGLVTNCVVAYNRSVIGQYAPSALASINGVVADCKIHHNYGAGAYGGGFFQYGAGSYSHDIEIYEQRYTGGYSYGSAMGGRIDGGLAERFYVHDNLNSYGYGGGNGAGLDVWNAELRNSLIVRNQAGGNGGGGVRIGASGARIVNCTIADNDAGQNLTNGKGGGLLCLNNTYAVTIVNTVFSGNTVTISDLTGGDPDWNGLNPSICTIRNCVFSSAASAIGENAIVADNPRYADPENGDYTPGVGSALRDAGAAWNWTANDIDLAGNPRVAGSAVDVGCLEAEVDESISCTAIVSGFDNVGEDVVVEIGPVGADLTGFEARVVVTDSTGATAAASSWGGSLLRLFHLAPGEYSVTVEVRNGTGTTGGNVEGAIGFVVSPPTVYVVPETARLGAPVFPYTTWETAATNLVDATRAAGNGTRVIVTNGTHVIDAPAVFGKASEIVSVEGPEKTEIVRAGEFGKGTRMQMVTLGTADTSLSGFTVRNGYGEETAFGALVCNVGGTVSNCVFTAAKTAAYYGGAVYNGNGLVTHCVFTNMPEVIGTGSQYYQFGDAARGEWLVIGGTHHQGNFYTYGAVTLYGGVLRNSVITNNLYVRRGNGATAGGVYLEKGRLENCLIAHNLCGSGGGGIRVLGKNCEIVNCTVVSNSCVGTDPGHVGGIAISDNASASILNTIVWNNKDDSAMATDSTYDDFYVFGSGSFSATTSLLGGTDPKFVKFAPEAGLYNYRLRSGSPAINAGTLYEGCREAVDLDGNPRLYGSRIDLGCYENQVGKGLIIILE
jgi:hypothetical protein